MSDLTIAPQIEESWQCALQDEFTQPYFAQLKQFLLQEKAQGHTIFPKGSNIFAAFNATPFDKVKVVILGQDPYHGPNQAHGLSFSVPDKLALPPSLKNIFKEIYNDLQIAIPQDGNLSNWAKQGVLLLNTVLTVRAHTPLSHRNQGWERFTDQVIRKLSQQRKNLVFVLWGSPARKKAALIDSHKHYVLEAAHPSPLSAHRGFFGCQHFSKINKYLSKRNITPINWQL